MNSKERFLKALSFEKTDTIPIYDIINNKSIYDAYKGRAGTDSSGDIIKLSAYIYKSLGIDVTRAYYRPDWQVGVVNDWVKYLNVPREGWVVNVNDETSWIAERPFNTLDDLRKNMPEYPDEKKIEEDFINNFIKKRDSFAPDVLFIGSIGGFLDLSYRFMGYELFCEGMYDDMGLIDEIMDIFCTMQKIYSNIYAKYNLGPAYVYCDDIAFKTSLLFSPAFLREKYFPRLPEIFKPVKEKGIKVIFHSDGNLNQILKDLIECGIDALNPLEKFADMDIVNIRRKCPDLPLVGGIDCSELLAFGTLEDIRNEVKRIIGAIGRQGGIVLGSTSEIHSGVPLENCEYLYKTIKEYGAALY